MAAGEIAIDAMDATDVTAAGGAMAVMDVMGVMPAGGAMAAADVMVVAGATVVVDVYRCRHRELKVEVEKVVTVRRLTTSRGSASLAYRARVLVENRDVR